MYPVVELELPESLIVSKPVDWEVYDGSTGPLGFLMLSSASQRCSQSRLMWNFLFALDNRKWRHQLSEFLQQVLSYDAPILSDADFGCGALTALGNRCTTSTTLF